jgi:uncharacterized protein (TIGR02145 family)
MKMIKHLLIFFLTLSLFTSCEDDEVDVVIPALDSIADIEGNIYRTVKIGDKWWMAEDLKVKKFRNGDLIGDAQNESEWTNASAAFCLLEGNPQAPGLLYNWEAVNHPSGLAPEGWHVATEADWQELERFLGMSVDEIEKINWRQSGDCGDQLKVKGPQTWLRFEGVWGNNKSGFSALTSGCRLNNGSWANPGFGSCGYWWTATEKEYNTAYFRNLDYKKSGVFRYYVSKNYGMAVRCVKN